MPSNVEQFQDTFIDRSVLTDYDVAFLSSYPTFEMRFFPRSQELPNSLGIVEFIKPTVPDLMLCFTKGAKKLADLVLTSYAGSDDSSKEAIFNASKRAASLLKSRFGTACDVLLQSCAPAHSKAPKHVPYPASSSLSSASGWMQALSWQHTCIWDVESHCRSYL